MPNFATYGLYSGGVVTKGSGSDAFIYISPFMVHGFSGRLAGMGASYPNNYAKKIAVYFGGTQGGYVSGDNTMSPSYTIQTGSSSGSVYLFYDESKNDIAFSPVFLANVVIFAKISWTLPLNMANVTVNTSYVANPGNPNRIESNMAAISNPQDAVNFYYDGQKFRSGSINRPLANMSVVLEALQEESLSSLGSTYFITLINQGSIYKSGNDLGLYPSRHIARESGYSYKTYNSKFKDEFGSSPELTAKRTFNLVDVNGDNIYITLERSTGDIKIFLATQDIALYNLNTTHYLIARSIGPHSGNVLTGVTDINQIQFEIVNNVAGLNSVKSTLFSYIGKDSSCVFNESRITGSVTTNSVNVPEMYGHIQGNPFLSYASVVSLGAPPALGLRQDFIFLQLTKKFNPDIIVESNVRVFNDIDILTYPNPFSNPNVRALLDDNLTLGNVFNLTSDGSYKSTGNSGNSEYFAIPLAVVSRFNTGVYSVGNINGASVGSRPDAKLATIINDSEIENMAPTYFKQDIKNKLGKVVTDILQGHLNPVLSPTNGSFTSLSREPLHTDYIGSYTYGTKIGDVDGARRFWAGTEENDIRMGFASPWNASFTYPYANFSYNIGTGQSIIDIRIPASYQNDASILTDIAGQPLNVDIFWKSDRTPVELKYQWTPAFNVVGDLIVVCTNEIDILHPSYIAHATGLEEIVVCFSVNYVKPKVLTNPVKNFHRIQLNGNTGKDNHLAHSPQSASNVSEIFSLNSVVIGANTHVNKLQLNKSISTVKGHSYEILYHVAGNNSTSTAYSIPSIHTISVNADVNGTYQGLYVVQVLDKNNQNIGVRDIIYKPAFNTFEIFLTQNILTTDPVKFVIGLEGKQIDINYGSMGVKNLTNAEQIQVSNVGAAPFTYRYFDTPNNIGGHIITGMMSFNNRYHIFVESPTPGLGYVQIPIKAIGFGGNLLQFDSFITAIEYNNLSTMQKACYQVSGLGYSLTATSDIIFSVMRGLNELNSIVLSYSYGASPFQPVDLNREYTLLDEGVVILTTDGAGNDNESVYSPVSEKFPTVQGVLGVVGSYTPAQTGITPSGNLHQTGYKLENGRKITFNNDLGLGVFVQANKGKAVYLSLVEDDLGEILGFAYVLNEGQLIINNPQQAFTFKLDYRYRG